MQRDRFELKIRFMEAALSGVLSSRGFASLSYEFGKDWEKCLAKKLESLADVIVDDLFI